MPDSSTRPLPEAVTKPLLDRILLTSVDEDFRLTAEERKQQGLAPRAHKAGVWTLVVVLVFGGLVAVAAVQTSREADVRETSREVLIDRIDQRQRQVAALHRQIARISDANQRRAGRLQALTDENDRVSGEAADLAESSGFGPVSGSGVRMSIDDSPDGSKEGRVRDTDVAVLVDGLFAAGATAVSVDGQRVNPRSGVSTSGSTLRMNNVALSPPYEVLAVGDPRTLQARFNDTGAGQLIIATANTYHMPLTMKAADGLTLPAAPDELLRLTELGGGEGASSDTPSSTSGNTSKKNESRSGEDSE